MAGFMLLKLFPNAKSKALARHSEENGVLIRRYRDEVEKRRIHYDEAQFQAIHTLQSLLDDLQRQQDHDARSAVGKWLARRPEKCRSLYLYGNVGRGKSMLMDWFHEACPMTRKRRVHFSTFMQEVHAFLHQCRKRNKTGAFDELAGQITASAKLLCFDEFHVTDIADAMILGRLFSKLFELGVVTVMTSNRHPDDLYLGGLQREQFLAFIKILHKEAEIIELAAKKDFRLGHFKSLKTTYHFPLDHQADAFIKQSYRELTNHSALQPATLEVLGRTVTLKAAHGDVALSSFEQLCVQPMGAADYLAIADEFGTLILSGIPKLTPHKRNEARRFVILVDTLYEHKVKLICTAEVDVDQLYTEGDGAFEFRRTVSRLIEMQSEKYLSAEHAGT
ncbi:MAG: cell division protein ZapE [Gammaproteobacteria bacterium]